MSFIFPLKEYEIIKGYEDDPGQYIGGMRQDSFTGIALKAKLNDEVFASETGKVIEVGKSQDLQYENYVKIYHYIGGRGYITVYAHLDSIAVKNGQEVRQGQLIGRVGISRHLPDGNDPQIIFEIRVDPQGDRKDCVNPLDFIGKDDNDISFYQDGIATVKAKNLNVRTLPQMVDNYLVGTLESGDDVHVLKGSVKVDNVLFVPVMMWIAARIDDENQIEFK